MKKFIIILIIMSVIAIYTASSQDIDSIKCVATEIAIEDFLNCRLCDESNVFIIDYSTKINSRRQLEIHIMRVIEDEEKFVVDPTIGFLRKHSYRKCVERGGKLFIWYSDTMNQEDFDLLEKYGMLYCAKDSDDYEIKVWEYLPNNHDDIETAQYFFCTSNPKHYKRIIDIYPRTVKLRCRK